MEISTTLIFRNENKTAVFAESYYNNLSLIFRFNLNIS